MSHKLLYKVQQIVHQAQSSVKAEIILSFCKTPYKAWCPCPANVFSMVWRYSGLLREVVQSELSECPTEPKGDYIISP